MSIRLLTHHYLYSANGLRDSGKQRRLSEEEWSLIECMEDEDSSHVATITDSGKLVGWFRMTLASTETSTLKEPGLPPLIGTRASRLNFGREP
jgi:hypothetical protein